MPERSVRISPIAAISKTVPVEIPERKISIQFIGQTPLQGGPI